jgi:uncharacterized RDD family membrane protein YckC
MIGWLILSHFCGSAAGADKLICAGNQNHFWFAAEPTPQGSQPQTTTQPAATKVGGFELYHHATDLGGPYYKSQNWLAREPLAMASWDNRVWVVFPAKNDAPSPRFEVYSIEVQKNPALDVYMSVPAGRMDILPPLTGEITLLSFIGTAQGPLALVLVDSPETKASLLQLQHGQWEEIALPSGFGSHPASRLAAGGQSGSDLVLLTPDPANPARTYRFDRSPGGEWKQSEILVDASRIRTLVNVNGRLTVVQDAGGSIELTYLRSSGLIALTTLPAPPGPWSIVGFGGSLQLVSRTFDGAIEMQSIGSIRGDIGRVRRFESQPLTTGKLWQVSMLVGVSISGLLLVFLIKPVSKAPVTLPPGTLPLPVSMRLGALLLDILPAGVIVGLLMRKTMGDMLNAPVLTIDLEQSVPFLLMAGLTIVHCTVTEMVKGTSLGKALVGGRVSTVKGEQPRPRQVLLRNALKCLILIVPPLAVFALINPHLQGLPDIAAGTVVVYEPDDPAEHQAEDR